MNIISVIIPTYQHATTLPTSLTSLLSQTRKPDEMIVVDDGSSDSTIDVVAPFLDRVRYIKQAHQGAPVARNNGCEASRGDLVIFWDADVIGEPTMLEKFEDALQENPNASWAYSSFYWGRRLFKGRAFDPQVLRQRNYIHTTSLIRRDAFPGFDPTLQRFQDWDVWLTMSEQGKSGVFVDEVLFRVVVEPRRPSSSLWLPRFAYRIPWGKIGWAPKAIRLHDEARSVIFQKHKL